MKRILQLVVFVRGITLRVFSEPHVDLVGTLVMARCRNNCPGSKFVALLPPAVSNFAEKLRLFTWGMDGFVELHETWQAELPLAVNSILNGQFWVPREVLETFMKRLLKVASRSSKGAGEKFPKEQQNLLLRRVQGAGQWLVRKEDRG